MGELIFKLDCELVYKPGEGIEMHLKYGGGLSREVTQHLARAGKELSLALQNLAKVETESVQKVRTKIEVEEAGNGKGQM
ncbi:MAG: hypothetical protein Q7K03_07185 [Dehalococcoidia bacterium]|nr:hypothetical protein [Dehalococcoidia bacterium]